MPGWAMRFYKICKLLNDIKLVKCLFAIFFCIFLFPACTGGKITWASKIQDTNNVESLIAALSDKNPKIRSSAAIKLQKTNDYRAVEPLISASKKDEDLSVQVEAGIALGKIRDPRAVESLIAALNNRKLDPQSAALAARSLGEINDPRAIEPLIAAYNDYHNSYHLRIPAGDALVKMGPPAIAPLISALKGYGFGSDSVRETAIRLVKIGRPAVDALIVALKDKHPDVRSGAAYALGEIRDPRAVGSLIIALKDKDNNVRKEVADALAKIGRPAVESLIAIMKDTDLYDSAWAA